MRSSRQRNVVGICRGPEEENVSAWVHGSGDRLCDGRVDLGSRPHFQVVKLRKLPDGREDSLSAAGIDKCRLDDGLTNSSKIGARKHVIVAQDVLRAAPRHQ